MKKTDKPRSRREEYAEATRQALIAAGRAAFARDGFQAAGIEAISREARVTRGAFYHHFEDKLALLDAAVVEMQAEAAARVAKAARAETEIWDRLRAGIDAYLDVCLEPEYGRIVVQEASAVLGASRFAEIEEDSVLALLAKTLETLARQGQIQVEDVDILCRLVDAMICRLSLMLSHAEDPAAIRETGARMINVMLDSLRPT